MAWECLLPPNEWNTTLWPHWYILVHKFKTIHPGEEAKTMSKYIRKLQLKPLPPQFSFPHSHYPTLRIFSTYKKLQQFTQLCNGLNQNWKIFLHFNPPSRIIWENHGKLCGGKMLKNTHIYSLWEGDFFCIPAFFLLHAKMCGNWKKSQMLIF